MFAVSESDQKLSRSEESRLLVKRKTMADSERYTMTKIAIDFVLTALVGLPNILFHYTVQPTHRGFFCDDETIRYPYLGSTVTTAVLFSVGFLLPSSVIALNEYFSFTLNKRKENKRPLQMILGKPIPPFVWEIYKQVGVFVFGACVVIFATGVGKHSVGRLRPNFLDVCRPNMTELCSGVEDKYYYVQKYDCLSGDTEEVRESRQSFPSGHASMSSYAMFYLVFYLQGRMCVTGSKLVKPFLQFILVMMTWTCSLSRIVDNKHHWSDVIAGFALGASSAAITIYYLSDIFKSPEREADEDSSSSDIASIVTGRNYQSLEHRET